MILKEQLQALPQERLRFDEPMSRHTTFRIGGPADALFFAHTEAECRLAAQLCARHEIPLLAIGKGSNLLVRDGGIRGLVLVIGEGFDAATFEGVRMHIEAGASMKHACTLAIQQGLRGLEFASGIPGTVGGGARMNAGAYDGELSQVIESIDAMDQRGEALHISREALDFGYRSSALSKRALIALRVTFHLQPGDPEAARARVSELQEKRRSKQPLHLPSAGSIFKRPPGDYAGRLIEGAGLKGLARGGAQVSEMHANFIVNTGGATAQDVLGLMEDVRQAVHQRYGVWLQPEVHAVGEG